MSDLASVERKLDLVLTELERIAAVVAPKLPEPSAPAYRPASFWIEGEASTWYWRLVPTGSKDGAIAEGKGYASEADCLAAIDAVQRLVPMADIKPPSLPGG